ncbi:NLP3 [Scenedesmus sp. PABB004]|nr:NLP3 [Scenedesmus sp. PABB004]
MAEPASPGVVRRPRRAAGCRCRCRTAQPRRWQVALITQRAAAQVKAALCQLSVTADKQQNIATARAAIEEAAAAGAKLVVLPEMWNCPYSNDSFPTYAEDLEAGPSPSAAMMADAARACGVTLVGGSVPEASGGRLYNTCCVYGPGGELLAKHRKVHLFDIDIPGKMTFRESATLSPGAAPTVVDTPAGRLGVGICYDIRFPELAMLCAARGAQALVYPGAFNTVTGPLHWELLARARAVDNQCFVLTCSPARSPGASYQAWGHSAAVGPFAEVLASCGAEPATVYADLDFAQVAERRANLPLRQQKRLDLYELLDKARLPASEAQALKFLHWGAPGPAPAGQHAGELADCDATCTSRSSDLVARKGAAAKDAAAAALSHAGSGASCGTAFAPPDWRVSDQDSKPAAQAEQQQLQQRQQEQAGWAARLHADDRERAAAARTAAQQEELMTMIWHERALEAELAPAPGYLDQHQPGGGAGGGGGGEHITPQMRSIVVSWLSEVAAEFNMQQETLFLAVALMDRFMAGTKGVPRSVLQLVAVACVLLASKQDEVVHPSVEELTDIAANCFQAHDLLRMERVLLDGLAWRIKTPTAYTFLHLFTQATAVQRAAAAAAGTGAAPGPRPPLTSPGAGAPSRSAAMLARAPPTARLCPSRPPALRLAPRCAAASRAPPERAADALLSAPLDPAAADALLRGAGGYAEPDEMSIWESLDGGHARYSSHSRALAGTYRAADERRARPRPRGGHPRVLRGRRLRAARRCALFRHGVFEFDLGAPLTAGDALDGLATFASLEFLSTALFITTREPRAAWGAAPLPPRHAPRAPRRAARASRRRRAAARSAAPRADDSMHGAIAPNNRFLNDVIGALCVSLYAWFDFDRGPPALHPPVDPRRSARRAQGSGTSRPSPHAHLTPPRPSGAAGMAARGRGGRGSWRGGRGGGRGGAGPPGLKDDDGNVVAVEQQTGPPPLFPAIELHCEPPEPTPHDRLLLLRRADLLRSYRASPYHLAAAERAAARSGGGGGGGDVERYSDRFVKRSGGKAPPKPPLASLLTLHPHHFPEELYSDHDRRLAARGLGGELFKRAPAEEGSALAKRLDTFTQQEAQQGRAGAPGGRPAGGAAEPAAADDDDAPAGGSYDEDDDDVMEEDDYYQGEQFDDDEGYDDACDDGGDEGPTY